jgi:Xaa-Pro aminopeptidase
MAEFKADTALYITNVERTLASFIGHDRPIYYTFGINPKVDDFMRRAVIERRSGGNWAVVDPAPILNQMRLIKNYGDWRMGMKKSIDISAEAHIEAIKSIEPGMYEYEVQAVFEYVFRKNGSPRDGYQCIVGSGANSTILHYNVNSRKMKAGDMVVMDCGAEYGYYSADITRSVPVSGKFTNEQKDLYQIVLAAQKAAIAMVRPGVRKSQLDSTISDILGEGLVKLGLMKDKGHHRMFSLHGYAHWIGLEVHDVGAYTVNGRSVVLKPGMVFTVEPGLYVRPDVFDKMKERGYSEAEIERTRPVVEKYMYAGIRIEDDIVVTENGHRNLSAAVPREIDDIETLMREKGIGNLELTYR